MSSQKAAKAYPHPSSAAASAVMRANKKRNTGPEIALRRMLFAQGARYRVHLPIRAGGILVRPDIVFPARRIAVFLDGCFWHSCPEHGTNPKVNTSYWGPKLERNRQRDELVTRTLESDGWLVLRIWEHVEASAACSLVVAAVASRPLRKGSRSTA
jgi:DNA mismatch endonuclease, patch repair protein